MSLGRAMKGEIMFGKQRRSDKGTQVVTPMLTASKVTRLDPTVVAHIHARDRGGASARKAVRASARTNPPAHSNHLSLADMVNRPVGLQLKADAGPLDSPLDSPLDAPLAGPIPTETRPGKGEPAWGSTDLR